VTEIRPARPDELPALTTIAGDEERNAATAAYLTGLLESGASRREWCLVADPGTGIAAGNIVLWAPPGRDVPTDFVLFEPVDAGTAEALLAAAGDLARGLGAGRQAHVLDQPAAAPQFQRDPDFRGKVLSAAGFGLDRDGRRFSWSAAAGVPATDPRLSWRSLAELGNQPFVDFIEDALRDTADAIFRAEIEEHGVRGAAELNFADCLGFDHQPEWFEIGYAADGSPAALSLAANNGVVPIVALIAVSSAHRGQGFATAALARCTQVLAGTGATAIRGDCDVANTAMARAFERCGYDNFANRTMWSRLL
jgi:RimJ/RimL family protein N-acetyltransferase